MAADQASGVSDWMSRLDVRTRHEVEEVAGLVTGVEARLTQAIKWGRLTFALDDNWHHWVCSIAVTKRTSSLVFHKGVLLDDPGRLLEGTARYVRQLPLATARQHPAAVADLVRSAIDHETDLLE